MERGIGKEKGVHSPSGVPILLRNSFLSGSCISLIVRLPLPSL